MTKTITIVTKNGQIEKKCFEKRACRKLNRTSIFVHFTKNSMTFSKKIKHPYFGPFYPKILAHSVYNLGAHNIVRKIRKTY